MLAGPDGALKASLVAQLVDTIEPDFRPFNVDKLFPPDNREEARRQFWSVLQLARTLPMMAPRRVIVVAQAEKLMPIFKAGDDEVPAPAEEPPGTKKPRKAPVKSAGAAELEGLEEYLSNPSPDAVLVFVAGDGLNRTLKPVKLLEQLATTVECDPLPGGRDATEWVMAEAAGEGRAGRARGGAVAGLDWPAPTSRACAPSSSARCCSPPARASSPRRPSGRSPALRRRRTTGP